MSDAPERIWANPDHWIKHPPRADVFRPYEYAEYIRADHVDTLLKQAREEALREAAEVCENVRLQKANGPMPERACFDYEQRILALIGKTNPGG